MSPASLEHVMRHSEEVRLFWPLRILAGIVLGAGVVFLLCWALWSLVQHSLPILP